VLALLFRLSILPALAAPTLPELARSLPPAYPPEALAQGIGSVVELELDVSAEGAVVDVRVTASGGAPFDAAAVQAAWSYRFAPARDDRGRPVPATVIYRSVFEPGRAPPTSVAGVIRAAGTREPLGGYDLVLIGPSEVPVRTGADGTFRVAGLDPGTWTLSSAEPGYALDPVPVEIRDGAVTELALFPVLSRPWEASGDGASEEIVVTGERVAPQITERAVSRQETRYLPGTNGDVVRVVQNLPGVARPPLNIGQLVIRGTAPEDSAYYLDGARIPNVFHFAGLSTVLNGDAIARIVFLPGNYGVRYGRTLGGAVELRTDPALPERSRGYVSLDLFQATMFAEQRVGDRTAVTLSGRRSYADVILNPILDGLSAFTIRVPRYYDLQVRLLGTTRRGTLDVLFFLSDDQFSVLEEDDGVDEVQIGLSTRFQKVRLLARELRGPWQHETSVIGGPESQAFELAPDGRALEAPITFGLRDEWLRERAEGVPGLRVGADVEIGWYRYAFDLPALEEASAADAFRFAPGIYAEATLGRGPLSVTPGLRADVLTLQPSGPDPGQGYGAAAIDPRLAARLDLAPGTALKASAGGYSQFPTVRQAVEVPSLQPARSWQLSVGAEQDLGRALSAEVTAYSNALGGLVSGREDAFRFFTGPPPVGPLDDGPYANDGTGRIYGVEALLRWSDERTTGWIAATFGRSTRVSRPGEPRELFEYDQPVVLTAIASRELPGRWRLGVRGRYGSGNPYTPVVNRYLDLVRQTWRPVYGEEDSSRLPPFWSVDTRIDKDFVFRRWTLTTYLDLQNATNRANVELIGWSEDYSEERPITGLPLVPAFGVRGEW
jgi:TonB family protein